MKTAHFLIEHLYHTPSLQKLQVHHQLMLLFERFFPSLAPKVFCFKLENQTLKIALRHPAHIKEFKYHENTIKKALKAIKLEEYSFLHAVEKIVVFDSRFVPSRTNDSCALSSSEFRYCENAEGDFANLATTPEIAHLFEELRAIIVANHRLAQLDGEEDYYRRINEKQ